MFRQPITWLSECFGGHTRPSAIGTFLPVIKFRFCAPEEINLGTGKSSFYCRDVPLSGKQLTRMKGGSRHITPLEISKQRSLRSPKRLLGWIPLPIVAVLK